MTKSKKNIYTVDFAEDGLVVRNSHGNSGIAFTHPIGESCTRMSIENLAAFQLADLVKAAKKDLLLKIRIRNEKELKIKEYRELADKILNEPDDCLETE